MVLSILKPSFLGLAHFSVGNIFAYVSFLIASTSGKFGEFFFLIHHLETVNSMVKPSYSKKSYVSQISIFCCYFLSASNIVLKHFYRVACNNSKFRCQ